MYFNKEPLHQNPKSKFIVIKDSKLSSCYKMYKTLFKLCIKEGKCLRAYSYERSRNDLLFDLNVNTDNAEIIDAVSDPHGWDSNVEKTCFSSINVICQQLVQYKGTVFMCSLTPLLYNSGINEVYKSFHKLLKQNVELQIVAIFHADVHPACESDIIESLATTVIDSVAEGDNFISTVHYPSGKVSKQLTECKISPSYDFVILRDIELSHNPVAVKQPDPTENLPFNLRLKQSEIEARSQLQLPYMKMQTDDDAIIQNILESEYYDEDDPDDDLDI
ncbi:elongator complex protein 5-like [Uloborus diversus]|uniref:elongator complex protein 5-like n=1 Tax=Uloborus diversus TaxID=327109 RepID=UPI0024090B23|nr:elongator complex protein 5-like [Uloborus diversus]